jgi:phosphatidylinositol 4-kinase
MIQVMGGDTEQQPFKQFSELVVKAYLASRPYAELIMQLVRPMLESGLPCFRGETIKRMQTRFQLDKSDRSAADFMIQRIRDSFENQRTVLYDYFQKVTNGKWGRAKTNTQGQTH